MKPQPSRVLSLLDQGLYPLCLAYTVVLFACNLAEFLSGGSLAFEGPAASVYLALLAGYAGEKELRRHLASPESEAARAKRKGEAFVYAWAIFELVAYLASNLDSRFAMPRELTRINLQAIGVFFGSRVSKRVREARYAAEEDAELSLRILRLLEGGPMTSLEIAEATRASRRHVQKTLTRLAMEGRVVKLAARPNDPETCYRLPGEPAAV